MAKGTFSIILQYIPVCGIGLFSGQEYTGIREESGDLKCVQLADAEPHVTQNT